MTIDERIEKLTERHEALAQSVEILTMDLRTQQTIVTQLVGGIQDLVTIVRSHETRISRMEEQ